MPRTLLVASAGGHLQQLLVLTPRFDPPTEEPLWVTYDTVPARSLLEGQSVVHGYGPSTRSIPNAMRNWRLSDELIDPAVIGRVVSTGAGIAVPFLIRARYRGVEAHYIESATRVNGPSLTGRILERVRGICLYTQHEWQRDGWTHVGSVFDSFSVREGAARPPRHLLIALGTHRNYRFEALVLRAATLIEPGDEITWQLGVTPATGLPGIVERELPSERFERLLGEVDVVVAHAGTGLALSALQAGKTPVLVPRRAHRGEHVDDHQVATAKELDRRGLAVYREVDQLSRSDLELAAGHRVERIAAPPIQLDAK